MNEMRKWINAMEAIEVADVETIEIDHPIAGVDWRNYQQVCAALMLLVRISLSVKELMALYTSYVSAREKNAVGSEFLYHAVEEFIQYLISVNGVVKTIKPSSLMEDEVLDCLYHKCAEARDNVGFFLETNKDGFAASNLMKTNIHNMMEKIEEFHKILSLLCRRISAYHLVNPRP